MDSALDPVAVWWVVCCVRRRQLCVLLTYHVVRGVDTKSRVRVEGWIVALSRFAPLSELLRARMDELLTRSLFLVRAVFVALQG